MIIFTLLTYVSSALAGACIEEITHKNGTSLGTKIMDGFLAVDRMYPFVVAIFESGKHVCGGTILSSKYVLTAARCVDKSGDYTVVAGTVNITKEGVRRKINNIILHPEYHFDPEFGDVLFNLAVAGLKTVLPLHPDKITPIKLPHIGDKIPFHTCGTALGWGLTNLGDEKVPTDILKGVRLFREHCVVDEYYFCVGHDYEARDFCIGDTGGPFIVGGTLYGIISHHQETDCASGIPSVLVSVPYFVHWIKGTADLIENE